MRTVLTVAFILALGGVALATPPEGPAYPNSCVTLHGTDIILCDGVKREPRYKLETETNAVKNSPSTETTRQLGLQRLKHEMLNHPCLKVGKPISCGLEK